MHYHQRINDLKAWKAKALNQMQLMFHKLKDSVPSTVYEDARRELEVALQKNSENSQKELRMIDKLN